MKTVPTLARANSNAAFDFVQKMSGVKSSSVFVELWAEHARKQVETLTEQTKQLAALAQLVVSNLVVRIPGDRT
jgi:hypothetical protein